MIIHTILVCRWRLGRWSLNDDDDDADCIGRRVKGVFGISIYGRIGVFDEEQLTWRARLVRFVPFHFWGVGVWYGILMLGALVR